MVFTGSNEGVCVVDGQHDRLPFIRELRCSHVIDTRRERAGHQSND
jgi:hypothetical protein